MERRSNNERVYFDWLASKIDRGNDRSLIRKLYRSDFYPLVPNDDNRAIDGIKLRERFEDEENLDIGRLLKQGCTVLEMLIALAERMDDILYEGRYGSQIKKWFWELIDNLALEDDSDIDLIIRKLVERKYLRNGKGGLFPLKNPRGDQRNVELWYQMAQYIEENF